MRWTVTNDGTGATVENSWRDSIYLSKDAILSKPILKKCICLFARLCLFIYDIYMYVSMYVCMYVCMYICVCIYIYIYTV